MSDLRRLDLGCGPAKPDGFIGIDHWPFPGVDVVRDLARGLPFDDSTVQVIRAHHVLEHFDGEDLIFLVEEMWRVSAPGAQWQITLPDKTSPNAGKDYTHKKKDWDEWSFQMWEVNVAGEYLIHRGPAYRMQGKLKVLMTGVNGNKDRRYDLEVIK